MSIPDSSQSEAFGLTDCYQQTIFELVATAVLWQQKVVVAIRYAQRVLAIAFEPNKQLQQYIISPGVCCGKTIRVRPVA